MPVATPRTPVSRCTNPSQYTANINWGNGQSTSGMVSYNSSSGQFQVYGTMTYADEGRYPISVTINDSDGAQTTATATAAVGDAALTSSLGYPISATAGLVVSGPFGAFSDANTNAPASDFTVSINWGDGSASSAGTVTASGGSGGFVIGGSHTYTTAGTYDITATVTDVGGSQTTVTGSAYVSAPAAIVVSNPGNQSSAEGNAVSLQIQASGGSGSLSYGAGGLPAGLTIDSSSGLISGTLDYTDAETQNGQYSVTVTATDSTGTSGSTTFNWTVANTDTPPTLDNPGNITNWQGDAVALQLSASDPDGDNLTYSVAGLPNGLTLNTNTGLISGVLAAPDRAGSPYNVTVSASDGTNTVSQSFTWTVATVQIDPIADQTNLIGDSVSVAVNAWDTSGLPLTYSAAGLPSGVSINSSTGLISGINSSTDSVTMPYNVTVTATDGGDPASTTFAWNLSNFTLDNPGDQTNAEGDAVALQPTVATNGNPTLTFSAGGLPNGLSINPNSGLIAGTIANLDSNYSPYSVTISATDGVSTSSQTFNWTITHVILTAPSDQINAPGDTVSLAIQASDPDGDSLTYSAAGLPQGLSINPTTGLISGTIASTAGSDTPYSVTVTASDGTHTASDTLNWTVANEAVTVTNPGNQSNAEGDNVALQVNATDPSGNALNYSASGLPAGLQIDYASGLISGTMDGSAAETNGGVYQVTVLADDGQGNNGSATFTWNVSHTNQAPTLTNPGDQVDQTGDVVSVALSGYDGDGDTVTYSAAGLPTGLSIDASSGIISGTLPASAGSSTPYSVTATASDGTLTASQTFNWFVTAGVVTLTNPGDQTNSEGDTVSLQLSATDSNNATLSYQASGLPSGLSIDSTTGLISGTVSSGDSANGPYTVTVMATDTQGNSSAQQFTWNVNPVNLNPVVSNPGAQINAQGDVLSLQISATDPAGNGLTYSASGLPSGLTIDSSSGLISGVLSNNSATGSPYSVTVTATDGANSGSATFTWSVTNQAVTVMNPGTQSNTGGDAVSLQINASDPAQLALTYAAGGLPDGLSIDPNSGLISGTLATSDGGAYAVTVMASDSQGNSGSATFTWNVAYLNQAPTLANPGDQLNKTGDAVSVQLSGSDVDGDTVTYSAAGLPTGLSLDPTTGIISGTLPASAGASTPYSVTVTVSDGTLTANQTFNWFVTAGVVTLTNPGDQTNSEGDTVSLQLSATDSNNSTLSYQASGLPSGLSINSSTGLISGTVASGDSANGPYTVTVSATDTQGNSSAQQFTWNVNAPANTLTLTNPGNQSNAEGDNVSLQVAASDPDGDTLTYSASGLPIGLMIDPTSGLITGTVDYSAAEISGGQYNVTVTVNDGNGQTASQSFVWAIANTPQPPWLEYPTFQASPIGATVSLQLVGGSPDNETLTYSASGLPPGLSVDPNTGLISGTITGVAQTYTVTATVTDTSNLTASQTFTWQVGTPQILLSFDGQPVGQDFLAEVGSTVPVLVTLEGASAGLHTITISIPSGEASVSQSTFQLSDGGSTTIQYNALQVSHSFDDILLVAYVDGAKAGDKKGTDDEVTIAGANQGGNVRNSDTPAGMKDRIPPVSDPNAAKPSPWTWVAITITPTLKDAEVVVFQVANNGGNNGTVNFLNSADQAIPRVMSQKSGQLALVGMAQTAPSMTNGKPDGRGGNAGNLSIVAYSGTKEDGNIASVDTTKERAKSDGFSVAAIPIAVKMSDATARAGNYDLLNNADPSNRELLVGATYNVTYVSDSGRSSDLDQVKVSEKVVSERGGTGVTTTWTITPSGWTPAVTEQPQNDAHGPRVEVPKTQAQFQRAALSRVALQIFMNHPGERKIDQWFVFTDARTGTTNEATAPLVKNSGFLIVETATQEGNGRATVFSVGEEKSPNPQGGAQPGEMNAADKAVQRVRFNAPGFVVR